MLVLMRTPDRSPGGPTSVGLIFQLHVGPPHFQAGLLQVLGLFGKMLILSAQFSIFRPQFMYIPVRRHSLLALSLSMFEI